MSLLLSTAYFPPLDYFAAIASQATLAGNITPASIVLEAHEHYCKQSWRNRCTLLTASGKENLMVPIVHSQHHIPIRELKVDYSTPWLRVHQTAISSAYGHSAFFEHYKDEIFSILDSRPAFLFDLNLRLLEFLLSAIHLPYELTYTDSYQVEYPELWDLRTALSPKKAPLFECEKPYYQVFSEKFPFTDHLSILDLLFNEGPDSLTVLARMKKR